MKNPINLKMVCVGNLMFLLPPIMTVIQEVKGNRSDDEVKLALTVAQWFIAFDSRTLLVMKIMPLFEYVWSGDYCNNECSGN